MRDDPFLLPDGEVQVSFSGGRTSAFLLFKLLERNGPLPDRVRVVFANTGREFDETLDFVAECGRRWEVPITWVEYRPGRPGFEVVGHNSASRDGAPFATLVEKRRFLPHQNARFCTSELKVRPAGRFLRSLGWKRWTALVGIRADEPSRLGKPQPKERWTVAHPLAAAGVSRHDVAAFWSRQSFDLRLATINGRTPLGNCDGCFLKSERNLAALIRDFPDRAAWWEAMEARISEITGKPDDARFRRAYSRRELRQFVERQGDWIFDEDGALCQADGGDCL